MNRRELSGLLLAAGLAPAFPVAAQTATPVEGKDFTRISPPQPAAAAGQVEVLEFFSYGCPHCSVFEPMLDAWAKKLPAYVTVRRVPVPFLFNAENFQRTYYSLETLGLVEMMQKKIFAAVHVEKLRLDKPEDIAALVAKNGGDSAKFLAAFRSFSVATAISRARKLTTDYKIDGVPTLAVNGQYLTAPSTAGSAERALAVTDWLIAQSRKG